MEIVKEIVDGKIWRGEMPALKKDGGELIIDMLIVPILGQEGKPIQYFNICYDITEKKVQEELRRTNTLLQQERDVAEHQAILKDQFLSNMSHEIRTPLNAIVGIGNLILRMDNLTDKQREYLSIMDINAKSLLNLVTDILDLSKIEAGRIELYNKPFNLHKMLEGNIKSLLHVANAKRVRLELKLSDNFDELLIGDEPRLTQIILNLLSNGIKFTPAYGAVTLDVTKVNQTAQTFTLNIAVIDTGIGIPLEKQKAIFEPFTQHKEGNMSSVEGTGLGLSIVRKLVELFHSQIELVSAEGKGSAFSFLLELPIYKTNSNTGIQANNKNVANPKQTDKVKTHLSGMSILLVDDNEFNQVIAVDTIADINPAIQVTVAVNGEEAIELLKKNNQFDLILMDIEMSGINGFETTRIIRNELKLSIPIIGLSSHEGQSAVEHSLQVGMDDYLNRPIDEKKLEEKLMALNR